MTLNTMFCFLLTLSLLSSLYKRIMIKMLRKGFLNQDDYDSFLSYGIDNVDFRPFKIMKFLRLGKLVDTNIYYKIVSKIYLFQVLLSVLGFISLFVLNYFDTLNILKIKL